MAAIVCTGKVAGRTVILDDGSDLPDGAAVEVRLLATAASVPSLDAVGADDVSAPAGASLEQMIEALIAESRSERAQAARGLGELGDPLATESLLETMDDRAEEVRVAAEEALVQIGEAALEHLLPALVGNDQRRAAAQKVINRIDPNWAKSEAARAALPTFTAMLMNPNSFYRERETAARLLGEIGDAAAVESLTLALKKDESRFVRSFAALALGKIGDHRSVKPLLDCVNDLAPGVHEAVAEALGMFGSEAVDLLIDALEHRDSVVRKGAAEALEQIGDPRALQPLLPLLHDEDPRVREAAVEAISQIADARAVDPLSHALSDESQLVRLNAVLALQHIGDACVVPALVAALNDPYDQVRRQSALALRQFADADMLRPLLSLAALDPVSAEAAIGTVGEVLKVAAAEVPTPYLQTIVRLQDPQATGLERDSSGVPVRYRVDCTSLRSLAREELKRRGFRG